MHRVLQDAEHFFYSIYCHSILHFKFELYSLWTLSCAIVYFYVITWLLKHLHFPIGINKGLSYVILLDQIFPKYNNSI